MNHSGPAPFFRVRGGTPLEGTVTVHGMKNAALPAIVAACLSEEPTTLRNVPTGLHDVRHLAEIMRALGADVEIGDGTLTLATGRFGEGEVPIERASRIRWSILLMGAATALGRSVFVPGFGGCALGPRPHDIHLHALRALGGRLDEAPEGVWVHPGRLAAAPVHLRYPVISGTANALIAAVLAPGETVLSGAAYEPETADVVRLLNKMGARITLADPGVWHVTGVERLHGAEHHVMGDRFVAATFMAAAAVTGGRVEIRGASLDALPAEAAAWTAAGLAVDESEGAIHVDGSPRALRPTNIRTGPWPDFQSDLQPLHAVMMATAARGGESVIEDAYFSDRFRYLDELAKMGADVEYADGDFLCPNGEPGKVARIRGGTPLTGARVHAPDIRGGAALVVAALAAEGETVVGNAYQIQRGYDELDTALRSLGGDVRLLEPTPEPALHGEP